MADSTTSGTGRRRTGAVAVLLAACVLTVPSATTAPVLHEVTRQFVDNLALQVQLSDPSFDGFSAGAGKALYFEPFASDEEPLERSCSSCHGSDPAGPGRHVRTGKTIDPIALTATPDRFQNARKIRKNFTRNCKWVMGRECSAREMGDFLAFVTSPTASSPASADAEPD